MNRSLLATNHQWITPLLVSMIYFTPSLLMAHPGHHHPDEADEFDSFRATFLHSHGMLDYFLVVIAFISLAMFFFHHRPIIRVSALAAMICSLASLKLL